MQQADPEAQSTHSSAHLLPASTAKGTADKECTPNKAQSLWQKLKQEDQERKKARFTHVTASEAAQITGHVAGEARHGGEKGKGDKTMAAFLML